MADQAPTTCDQCDGRGWWSSGCESSLDCWQCHGTGVQRARGNCVWCLGWGWTISAHRCEYCAATGWVAADVALYWCADCTRTVEAAATGPACTTGLPHRLERVTASERPLSAA